MKQKTEFHFGVGASSILMIFTVLCLTVFSVLTFSTARADQRLTEKALDGTREYYAADRQAEETLARIDGILKKAKDLPTAKQLLAEAGFSVDPEGEVFQVTAEFAVGDNRTYRMVVELTGDPERRYRVLERSVQNTEGVWEDEALDIWDGK